MNKRIEQIKEGLDGITNVYSIRKDTLKASLQKEYNKVFDNDKALTKAMTDLESASEYSTTPDGINLWFRYSGLSDIGEDVREYLEAYLQDSCITVDWENDCLQSYQGDDNLIIQAEHGRDNGVWQGHKLIIKPSEYVDDNGEVDEEKRNALIEAHMERTGYYPGVFYLDYSGNVTPVRTTPTRVRVQVTV